ncbi:MAG: hypothetical protein RIS64_4556, partial [Bacteroidota bacterium]
MLEQAPKGKITNKTLELLRDKDVSKLIKSINDEYLYWDNQTY